MSRITLFQIPRSEPRPEGHSDRAGRVAPAGARAVRARGAFDGEEYPGGSADFDHFQAAATEARSRDESPVPDPARPRPQLPGRRPSLRVRTAGLRPAATSNPAGSPSTSRHTASPSTLPPSRQCNAAARRAALRNSRPALPWAAKVSCDCLKDFPIFPVSNSTALKHAAKVPRVPADSKSRMKR